MARIGGFWRAGLLMTVALAFALAAGRFAAAGQANQTRYVDVPVPATMIYAGQPVVAAELTTRRVASYYIARAALITDLDQLDGKIARSTLVPGRPIAVSQVREPNVINASKPVRIVYRSGSLVITGEVIPLSSASAGETVRARNLDTGLIVTGVAQPDGTLLVAGQ